MKIVSRQGDPNIAEVFVASFRSSSEMLAEFVDARDPSYTRREKSVIIVSTQFGCPVACPMCDAGTTYLGDLSTEEIFAQVDYIRTSRPDLPFDAIKKLKIQFARMGEPALNSNVLSVIEGLPSRYNTRGLIPCVATTAPSSSAAWFDRLLAIRHSIYRGKEFQLQFSINSTDEKARDRLMPIKKMPLAELGNYARFFYERGTRKVALNFALAEGVPVDPRVIADNFDPEFSCIKITPLNPTIRSAETGIATALPPNAPQKATRLCDEFRLHGFEVILSIGDTRENQIGSNCGMAVRKLPLRLIPSHQEPASEIKNHLLT